jgi:hypothetical protein
MSVTIINKPYNAGSQVLQNREEIVDIKGRIITKKELLEAKVLPKIFLSTSFDEKIIVT